MNIRRSLAVAGVALCAIGLGVESQAWACSPQAGIVHMSPPAGPPGEIIAVTGTQFFPGGAVELHWNSATGPVVAQGTGPEFTASFVVPESAPGTDYIYVVATDQAGTVTESGAQQAFVVTTGLPDNAPAPSSSTASQQQASSLVGVVPAADTNSATSAPAGGTNASTQAPTGAVVPTPARTPAASPASTPTPAPATTPAPPQVATVAAPAATVAPAAKVAAPAATVAPTATSPVAVTPVGPAADSPQVRALTQTVWGGASSGFKAGRALPSLANIPPASKPGSEASMLGIGLVVAGSLVIAGGLAVVALARRRKRVVAS